MKSKKRPVTTPDKTTYEWVPGQRGGHRPGKGQKPKGERNWRYTSNQGPAFTALHIGATKEAIEATRDAILTILNTEKCGDPPKVQALITLRTMHKMDHITVSDCNFDARTWVEEVL